MTKPSSTMDFRKARRDDLEAIIDLLADDPLGQSREIVTYPPGAAYLAAFAAIDADGNQLLAVAEQDGQVVGTLQIQFLPGLARQGALRGQIESVRVRSDRRSAGIGAAMIGWAEDQCRARGCALVQLTSDLSRADAHRFYVRLGYGHTHAGFKKTLGKTPP